MYPVQAYPEFVSFTLNRSCFPASTRSGGSIRSIHVPAPRVVHPSESSVGYSSKVGGLMADDRVSASGTVDYACVVGNVLRAPCIDVLPALEAVALPEPRPVVKFALHIVNDAAFT